jgi:hypothetical protein
MPAFQPFSGVITGIDNFWTGSGGSDGCTQLMSVTNRDGSVVNFVVAPTTYFVDQATVAVGDAVTGFYDANAAVPLIFPPQFRARVMARETPVQNVKVDFFDSQLLSNDGDLRLNIAPWTRILLENNQRFYGSPANRYLIVVYSFTTRSIPAQTTPDQVIVMC